MWWGVICSFGVSGKHYGPQPQENVWRHKIYYLGSLWSSDIVYELGLWNHTLKENGFTQQVLFKFYFGCYSEKIPSGDYIGYFAELGVFITGQILQGYD